MSPYVHEDYRDILRAFFSTKKARSGSKSEFAKALSIKTSYLSQVLSNTAHLTPEQIFLACRYFSWDEPETEYVLLCAQKDKCKNQALKAFYLSQLRKLKIKANESKNEIFEAKEDSSRIYYQNWLTPAVHKWVINQGPIEKNDLLNIFNAPRILVAEAVDSLLTLGLLQQNFGQITASDIEVKYPESPALKERFLKDCRSYALNKTSANSCRQLTRLLNTTELTTSALEKIIEENFKALQAGAKNTLYLLNVDMVPVGKNQVTVNT